MYEETTYMFNWLKPMLASKKFFHDLGYNVKFENLYDYFPYISNHVINTDYLQKKALDSALHKEFDILFIAFHHETSLLGKAESLKRINFLSSLKSRCNMIVWLDAADSTGNCQFDVLPSVDIYLKKQLLKDLALYEKPLYCSRLFCDYYHNEYGINDEALNTRKYPLLDPQYKDKIKLSWNLGLDNCFAKGIDKFRMNKLISPDFYSVNRNKGIDVHYRGSKNTIYGPLVGYQRAKCVELISSLSNISHPDMNIRIPYSEYIKEIQNSKAIVSPFGWGEVCYRDFEAFAFGATLLKPTMEHSITYPDFYKADETYIPISWDFSDFEDVISKVGSKEYQDIAEAGQKMFLYYRKDKNALQEFANHVIESIKL